VRGQALLTVPLWRRQERVTMMMMRYATDDTMALKELTSN